MKHILTTEVLRKASISLIINLKLKKMANTKSFSDLARLEWYLIALNNAKSDPNMSDPLNQIGISAEVLEEGRTLHTLANKAFKDAYAAKKKRLEVYAVYSKKTEAFIEQFLVDRKKAKIVFLADQLAQSKLELNRPIQKNRLKQLDMAQTFFTVLSENPDLLEPLSKLGVRADDVAERLEIISEIKTAWENYMLEKGISQNATNVKNRAINTLTKWMTQFFSISRNAFKEEPQMMEAFGFVVKN
jgi:hypothetical protein